MKKLLAATLAALFVISADQAGAQTSSVVIGAVAGATTAMIAQARRQSSYCYSRAAMYDPRCRRLRRPHRPVALAPIARPPIRTVGAPIAGVRHIVEHPPQLPGQYRCWDATGDPSGGPGTGDSWCVR